MPDLVIYLQAPADALRKRIAKRGLRYEQGMRKSYLQALCDSYMKFFHFYDESPLLIVNAELINPVDSDADYQALLARMASVKSGRQYYNPIPDGLQLPHAEGWNG